MEKRTCGQYREQFELSEEEIKFYQKHYVNDKFNHMENNFKNFFHLIDDLFIIGNMNGEILFVNDSVVENLGYSLEELQKIKIVDLHQMSKRNEASEILTEMLEGKRRHCPLELQRKNGTILPVETRIWLGKWNNEECIFGVSKNLSNEQEALKKFTKLFENNPALMAVSVLPEKKFVDVNISFAEKTGYSYNEIIGKTSGELDLFVQTDKQLQAVNELELFGKIRDVELQVKCKNGEIIDGLFSGEVIESQGKKYFLTVMVDITPQKQLQNLYNDEKIRLHSIIEGTNLGTWEWNVQTGESIINERWAEIIGYTLSELQPISIEIWEKFTNPDDLKVSQNLLQKHFNGEMEFYDTEARMRHKNGHWVWVHDRGKVIKWDKNGKPLTMYGTHFDITEKKEIEEKIKEFSIRDHLTNVYNRRYIFDKLNEDLEMFKSKHIVFSIAILDIDFFKTINDTYGHMAGDYILKEFTKIISENLSEYHLLGRYGGEEFIIILYDSDKEKASYIIERILENVRTKKFKYKNNEIEISFCAGIADVCEFDYKNVSIEKILSLSDNRLYTAKQEGRNKIIIENR